MVEEIHSTVSLSSASLTWIGISVAHYFSPRCLLWDPMTYCLGAGGGGGEVYTIIDNSSLPTSALELLCCFNNVLF